MKLLNRCIKSAGTMQTYTTDGNIKLYKLLATPMHHYNSVLSLKITLPTTCNNADGDHNYYIDVSIKDF